MRLTVRHCATALLGAALLAASSTVAAQPTRGGPPPSGSTPSKAAVAEELFSEGRRLLDQGKLAEACDKLAQSQRLDPSAGTLLNLADCHEKRGQTASAWLAFKEAARAALDRNRHDWVRLAEKRAAGLEPRLSRLTIFVPEESKVEGLQLFVDGAPLDRELVGQPLPLDPGKHVVEARAPGRLGASFDVVMDRESAAESLSIPPLALAPGGSAAVDAGPEPAPAPQADDPPKSTTSSPSPQRTIGFAVGGAGLAGLTVSAITALLARSAVKDARGECPTYPIFDPGVCTARAADRNDAARSFAATSTVTAIAGGALLAAGAVLVLTAPSGRAVGQLTVAPLLARGTGGIGIASRF
jgi:hypothetical protein